MFSNKFVAVMGSGGPNPATILGDKLLAWWTADRLDLLTLSGSAVASWRDVKNRYDMVQAVSASRPVYSPTSFNGAPGLTFDGTDDEMTCTAAGFLAAMPTGAALGEMWGVAQQDEIAANTGVRILAGYGGDASTSRRAIERDVITGQNVPRNTAGTGGGTVSVGQTSVNLSTRHVIRGRWTATAVLVSADNGAEASQAAVPATSANRARIGAISNSSASNYWKGLVRDVVMLSGNLTGGEAAALYEWALPRRKL